VGTITHHTPGESFPRLITGLLPILPDQSHCCNPSKFIKKSIIKKLTTYVRFQQKTQNKISDFITSYFTCIS